MRCRRAPTEQYLSLPQRKRPVETFFTVPRSVWRISVINSIGSGKWIGSGGIFNKGIRDMSYMANDSTIAAYVHQQNKTSYNKRKIYIEYGLSGRMTFSLLLPSYRSLKNEIISSPRLRENLCASPN